MCGCGSIVNFVYIFGIFVWFLIIIFQFSPVISHSFMVQRILYWSCVTKIRQCYKYTYSGCKLNQIWAQTDNFFCRANKPAYRKDQNFQQQQQQNKLKVGTHAFLQNSNVTHESFQHTNNRTPLLFIVPFFELFYFVEVSIQLLPWHCWIDKYREKIELYFTHMRSVYTPNCVSHSQFLFYSLPRIPRFMFALLWLYFPIVYVCFLIVSAFLLKSDFFFYSFNFVTVNHSYWNSQQVFHFARKLKKTFVVRNKYVRFDFDMRIESIV